MTIYEACCLAAFILLVWTDKGKGLLGSVVLSLIWPSAVAAYVYYLMKVRVFHGRLVGMERDSPPMEQVEFHAEVVGFFAVSAAFAWLLGPIFSQPLF